MNAINIKNFYYSKEDDELLKLIPFLKEMSKVSPKFILNKISQQKDVVPVPFLLEFFMKKGYLEDDPDDEKQQLAREMQLTSHKTPHLN